MKKIAIYNPYLETKGGGEKVCLALASVLSNEPDYEITMLTHNDVDMAALARYFQLDLEKVRVVYINYETAGVKLLHRLPLPGKFRNFLLDLKAHGTIRKHRYDIFINNCFQSNLPNPSPLGIYMCMFPQKLAQTQKVDLVHWIYYRTVDLMYRLALHPAHKNGVLSYQLVTANSEYTQRYIQQYWKRDSEIIYPICDDMRLSGKHKEKVILHVGRFFENSGENHHKRQDFLLESFAAMTKLHKEGWELHFAGSVAEDVGGLKYILELIKAGQNLPVQFHFNASYSELKDLYNRASIYWHATGFGVSPDEHPEKQEHFGITTVEAMSAKCIPIVINSAGQKESVQHGVNGYLWNSRQELSEFTSKVADATEADLAPMRDAARATSKLFNQASFKHRVQELFHSLD